MRAEPQVEYAPSVDDALVALLDLPRPYRITTLALMGHIDPCQHEQPDIRGYITLVNRWAAEGRTRDLIDAIYHIQDIRQKCQALDL